MVLIVVRYDGWTINMFPKLPPNRIPGVFVRIFILFVRRKLITHISLPAGIPRAVQCALLVMRLSINYILHFPQILLWSTGRFNDNLDTPNK